MAGATIARCRRERGVAEQVSLCWSASPNAALAVQTADARALHVIGAVVFAISAGALMLKSRRLEEG